MFSRRKEEKAPRGPIIQSSYVWAFVIAAVIGYWMFSGQIGKPATTSSVSIADSATESTNNVLGVRGIQSVAQPFEKQLTIRGQTQALRSVFVRAETSGKIAALPIEKGSLVNEGDVLCELDVDAREAQMDEASAIVNQKRLEWKASEELLKKGHRSKTQNAASKAGYESAKANQKRMQVELARTKIRAPFDGIFNDRQVEVGDFVQPGQVCGSVVDQSPFLVVAQISEREVTTLVAGEQGSANLISGESIEGQIRYISASAEPATRTFRVELEVPNEGGFLREGITADLLFPLQSVMAHLLSPAILGLDARGVVGVRTVDENNIVAFVPVEIIADTGDGVWVSGLPEIATVITVGQELVKPGQKVDLTVETPSAS